MQNLLVSGTQPDCFAVSCSTMILVTYLYPKNVQIEPKYLRHVDICIQQDLNPGAWPHLSCHYSW